MRAVRTLTLLACALFTLAPLARASWTASGRFAYEDRVYGPAGFTGEWDTLAIRSAIVELVDSDLGTVLARGGTAADGSFSLVVPGNPSGSVYVRVLTWTADSTRYRIRVRSTLAGFIYAVRSPAAAAAAQLAFNDGLPMVALRQGAGEAFNILDNLEHGYEYVADIASGVQPASPLTAVWTTESTDGTYYSGSAIHLLGDDGYSDAVITHEEGHFMAASFSRDNSPGGAHFLGDNDQDPRLAFSEGWATYFSLSVRRHLGLANPTWYCDLLSESVTAPALNFSYEIETPSIAAAGANSEVSVQAALWDIADDASVPDVHPGVDDDPLALGDLDTWNVMSGYLPTLNGSVGQQSTLETFWEGWFALGKDHLDEMRQTFALESIEFSPDSFENNDFAARAFDAYGDGRPMHQTFYPRGDVDWSRFQATAGEAYVLETTSLLGGANTRLTLYGPDTATVIAFNDDRSAGILTSRINFTPAVTGTYYLKCEPSTSLNVYGSYDLRITRGKATTATFTDVTTAAGVADGANSRGVAWGDYNRDGYPDLYVCNTGDIVGTGAVDRLYQNGGGLAFTDVAAGAGVQAGSEQHEGAAWADYDNDGYLDLLVASIEGIHLFHNNGPPAYGFTEVTAAAGLPTGASGVTQCRSVAWCDYDRDGFVDFYVTRYAADTPTPNVLFHNNRNGTFTAVPAGVEFAGHSFSAAWTDFDGDGRPDLAVGLDGDVDGRGFKLYRQKPDGTFDDVTDAAGLGAAVGRIFGLAWGDYDGDGRMDLIAANQTGPNFLFHNLGNGTFADVSRLADVQGELKGTSPAWFDMDNDGDLDLYVVNFSAPASMFDNLGSGVFTNSGLGSVANASRAVAAADIDRNGTVDVYVAAQSVNTLYRGNPVDGNHFLELRLTGQVSNTAAIGARVRVLPAAGAPMWREVSGGEGWGSQPSQTLHFGLGTATRADSVVVQWPSGLQTVLTAVAADQTLRVFELAGNDTLPEAAALHQNAPNPFSQSTLVSFDLPLSLSFQNVKIAVYSVAGRLERMLLDRPVTAGEDLQVEWDGNLAGGARAPQGVHFVRMTVGSTVLTRKMLLLR